MMNSTQVVHSDPDILGGTPVFIGTRVPVKTLIDYLKAGDLLDEVRVYRSRYANFKSHSIKSLAG